MSSSKKIFLLIAVIFIACLIYASIDIASRTTFPGSKPQLKERIKEKFQHDSLSVPSDSLKKM
jgi:hypothetical protein